MIRTWLIITFCLTILVGPIGCGSGDDQKTYEGGTWEVVADYLPGALLSVYAKSPTDIWAVGADPGDGKGGMVVRYDGNEWRRLSGIALRDIWWLSPGADADTLWLCGGKGLVLKCSMATEKCTDESVGGVETLFGIFATSANDVWAVGGVIQGAGNSHILWHYDGTGWSQVTDLPEGIPDGAAFFKVWGRTPSDVTVIGTMGVAMHYDGSSWTLLESGTGENLVTVHGNSSRSIVVGGFGSGLVLVEGESGYTPVELGSIPQLNGIHVSETYPPVAAGARGHITWESAAGWKVFDDAPDTYFDYHAVTVDSEGGIWAVGGNILLPPLNDGILVHYKPAP
jgi:hypothetical protein